MRNQEKVQEFKSLDKDFQWDLPTDSSHMQQFLTRIHLVCILKSYTVISRHHIPHSSGLHLVY